MNRFLIVILFINLAIPLKGQGHVKERETPPLVLLIQNNTDLQIIKNFIKKHPESLSKPMLDQDGKSLGMPLLHACFAGRKDVISLFLSEGANPNSDEVGDKTPIHFAVVTTDQETIRLFIKHGADINHRSYGRNLPLLDIFEAAGYENSHQDAVMEENLRFLLPLSNLTEEDILAMITYTKCIKDVASPEAMESHLRKLRIVQQFLSTSRKEHFGLNEFLVSFNKEKSR